MANRLRFKHLQDAYGILKQCGYSVSAFDADSRFIKAESADDTLHIEYDQSNVVISVR